MPLSCVPTATAALRCAGVFLKEHFTAPGPREQKTASICTAAGVQIFVGQTLVLQQQGAPWFLRTNLPVPEVVKYILSDARAYEPFYCTLVDLVPNFEDIIHGGASGVLAGTRVFLLSNREFALTRGAPQRFTVPRWRATTPN